MSDREGAVATNFWRWVKKCLKHKFPLSMGRGGEGNGRGGEKVGEGRGCDGAGGGWTVGRGKGWGGERMRWGGGEDGQWGREGKRLGRGEDAMGRGEDGQWGGEGSLTMWDIWCEFGVNYKILTRIFSTRWDRLHHTVISLLKNSPLNICTVGSYLWAVHLPFLDMVLNKMFAKYRQIPHTKFHCKNDQTV